MPTQEVDATLLVEQPDTNLAPLQVVTDGASPSGVALPVYDGVTHARLVDALDALADVVAALASVAVTGPLTNTQLRAVPVPVSGTVTTGGLTDTQLRATPVPVSGTVTTGGLTDTQLRATPVNTLQLAQLVACRYDGFLVSAMDGDDITEVTYFLGVTQVATLTLVYSAPGVIQTGQVTYP